MKRDFLNKEISYIHIFVEIFSVLWRSYTLILSNLFLVLALPSLPGETLLLKWYRETRGILNSEFACRSRNLTLKSLETAILEKFTSLKHEPIWKQERPESLRGSDELKIYKVYPVGLTQRQALYSFKFKGDDEFRSHLESNPCAKFEVIFV